MLYKLEVFLKDSVHQSFQKKGFNENKKQFKKYIFGL